MTFSLAVLTRSNGIQFFLAGKTTEINESGYCLDCFASCENIVWISFKRMYGKLLPPTPLLWNNNLPRPQAPLRGRKTAGSAGLNGKGTNRVASPFFSTTIPQLHGHRAQRSHNSMGTAFEKGSDAWGRGSCLSVFELRDRKHHACYKRRWWRQTRINYAFQLGTVVFLHCIRLSVQFHWPRISVQNDLLSKG